MKTNDLNQNLSLANFLEFQVSLGIKFYSKQVIDDKEISSSLLHLYFKKNLFNSNIKGIINQGDLSSQIIVMTDISGNKIFKTEEFALFEKMFSAIQLSVENLLIINFDIEKLINEIKKTFKINFLNFDVILRNILNTLEEKIIINMFTLYQLNHIITSDFNLFNINHPSELIKDPKLKKDAWETLKKIKVKLND